MNTAPYLSAALVEWLDHSYPHKAPDPADSEREIWMKAGERRLVDRLINRFNKQESDPLAVHLAATAAVVAR